MSMQPSPANVHPTASGDLARLVAAYAVELDARRENLLADRAGYVTKLADLASLDPLDFTGLAHLYREHLRQIDALLEELATNAVTALA
ncbi:MAG: hypothetical protein KDK06_06110 [Gammaproteobacteria bacterium]|nr:hypothetical protein [Gammaproteobacteria bacterium]